MLHSESALSTGLVFVRLVQGLLKAEECSIPRPKTPRSKIKPGPLPVVKAIKASKHAFYEWKVAGKPCAGSNAHSKMLGAKKDLRSTQRQCQALARKELYNDIMQADCGDKQLFFRLVNAQRSTRGIYTNSITYKDVTYKDSNVCNGFSMYFSDLATPEHRPEYDMQHNDLIENDLNLIDNLVDISYALGPKVPPVTEVEVAACLRKLKTGKAADIYGLTAEHLIYAKDSLIPLLAVLFSSVFAQGVVPSMFRDGLLLPLLKKPNKPRDIPTNYRGITIIPVIAKLFEVIIVGRVSAIFKRAQSTLQRGFTEDVSPLFAAFVLSETINEHSDTKSELQVALLDAEKAFDRVSHTSLFRKLAILGIPMECWKVLRDWYNDLRGSLRWNGVVSPSFHINQGTLQGSAFSPHAFKMYNNDTLLDIQRLHLGATIGTICCSAPTCADDVALLAPSQDEMIKLLSRVQDHANMDKLTLNPTKSILLQYVRKGKTKMDHAELAINNCPIEVQNSSTHLGILQGPAKDLNKTRVTDCIATATRTMYALFGAGMHGKNGMNPMVSKQLWTVYIIPRMLFGTELWQLNKTDLETLELYQRTRIKQIQGLPSRTANVAALGMLGLLPIQAEVDKRVLSLFRNLIADKGSIEYDICLRQLAMKTFNSKSWLMYVQQVLMKYDLPSAQDLLVNTPSKRQWRSTVAKVVLNYWEDHFLMEAKEKSTLDYCSANTLSPKGAALVWSSCKDSLHETGKASVKVKFMTGTYKLQEHEARYSRNNQYPINPLCMLCNTEPETVVHCLLNCPALHEVRTVFLSALVPTLQLHGVSSLEPTASQLVQLVLDPLHDSLPQCITANKGLCMDLEHLSRNFIYSVHVLRGKLLAQSVPPRPRKPKVKD
jgi:hypothetical protein